jgi:hypothetical protein
MLRGTSCQRLQEAWYIHAKQRLKWVGIDSDGARTVHIFGVMRECFMLSLVSALIGTVRLPYLILVVMTAARHWQPPDGIGMNLSLNNCFLEEFLFVVLFPTTAKAKSGSLSVKLLCGIRY